MDDGGCARGGLHFCLSAQQFVAFVFSFEFLVALESLVIKF